MKLRSLVLLVTGLLVSTHSGQTLDDLLAEESENQPKTIQKNSSENATEPVKKYSSRIRASDGRFGQKTSPRKSVLDFRIEQEGLRASSAGAGKGKEDDDEEKTLAQQVADGKYGLIQNEIFPQGSKRPGIISYLPNPEVPRDTKEDYGGLDKDEIWLAEDHVLVLRGGRFPQQFNDSSATPWPPIDDYIAPTRQVEIPKNPKIPPPFPVQLTKNGPLEFIRGENGSLPPRPPFFPPFPLPPPAGSNNSLPYPVPPGPVPPFLPPGAAFLPPPGNLTDFDEDDPSIYYPPRYDFYYPQDNSTAVPPGPLVPGIILPPPPDFFSPEKPNDEENETDREDSTTKPPYVAPAYLPTDRKPYKPRTYTKRPPVDKKTTVTYVYPERTRPKSTRPPGFTSPIYVPNTERRPVYHPLPTTSPRPNHITIPRNQTLKQEIYIVSTEPPETGNDIIDLIRETKVTKTTTLDGISPERHPLRSLIRPNVSVSYIGKVGHLPPSTAFPFPRPEPPSTESYQPPTGTESYQPPTPTQSYQLPHGHYITLPPSVTVTPIPIVKKIRVKPTETATQNPHATFFFYEEAHTTPQTLAEENEVSASPIDQFLKENFKPNGPDYVLKPVKTPTYVPKIRSRPRPKPSYTPPEEPHKLNALEIENSGLSGLQTYTTSTEPPITIREKQRVIHQYHQNQINIHPTTEAPFIPSNYYATANPASMHYTPIDPTIVDDITMKYFTIFGQKLHPSGGTTPLTPVPPTSQPSTPRLRPVHSYTTTTEAPRVVTIKPSTRPPPQSYVQVSTPKPRPPSHFEQFLQEITGEDQKDYIVSNNEGIAPPKIKKPKSRPGFSDNPNLHQYYLPYRPAQLSQYIENIYRPSHSTTLRPVTDVDIQPQYVPQFSTTSRPYVQNIPQRVPPKPLSHNFGQYLQEVVYTGPKGPNPSSNLQFFEASAPAPVRQQYQPSNQKPVSLEGDVLVNYRQPLPPVNPDAELLPTSYNSNSNIQVVQAPDLTRNRAQYRPVYQPPRNQRPPVYEPSKTFFENLPHNYFSPSQQNQANAFVSYNLPGNGGHFYFLTPQALDRNDGDIDSDDEDFGTVKRSENSGNDRLRPRRGRERGEQAPSRGERVHTSQDYLRRRRKKP